MNSILDSTVSIQTTSQVSPSTPPWLGEVTLIIHHQRRQGVFDALGERVRFARRRFGRYEVLDFVAVLIGYAISGERTLHAFYERLQPFAAAFMALFGREQLPARSTLSRFLASLTQTAVEALRTLFLEDGLARPPGNERQAGGLVDRAGVERVVFDIDGIREAARQRALPTTAELPAPSGGWVSCALPATRGASAGRSCAPVRQSCKRIRHSGLARLPTLATGGTGKNCAGRWPRSGATTRPMTCQKSGSCSGWMGQYGTGAVLADLSGYCSVMRGKDYAVLDRTEVQRRLHLPPDQQFIRPESTLVRVLYDCPDVPVGPGGQRCRVVIATHPASQRKSRIGLTRAGLVYELFFTTLPQGAFTAADVVALYLQCGAEDQCTGR